MVKKQVKPDLGNTAFEFSVDNSNPDIEDMIGQNLSYLIGYDIVSDKYRYVTVDSDGKIFISSGSVPTASANISIVIVGVAAIILLSTNTSRNSFQIFNNSANTIYVGFTGSVTTILGFPIPSGAVWSDSEYVGDIYAISSVAGNNIRIMEMG